MECGHSRKKWESRCSARLINSLKRYAPCSTFPAALRVCLPIVFGPGCSGGTTPSMASQPSSARVAAHPASLTDLPRPPCRGVRRHAAHPWPIVRSVRRDYLSRRRGTRPHPRLASASQRRDSDSPSGFSVQSAFDGGMRRRRTPFRAAPQGRDACVARVAKDGHTGLACSTDCAAQ